MLRAPVQVSASALDAVVRQQNLGELHTTLRSTEVWRDAEGERAYWQAALAELTRLGLAGPHGLDPDLQDSLHTLIRPAEEFYAWSLRPDGNLSVLGVSAGHESLLAVRQQDMITLRPVRPGGLAEVVVGQLPPAPPAHGRSVNLPESVVVQGKSAPRRDEGFSGFTGFAGSQPPQIPELQQLNDILGQDRSGVGELHAAVRDRNGRRYTTEYPVNFIDIPGGRWMLRWTAARDGERWLVAAPATAQSLVGKLHEMQREIVDPS